MALETIMHKSVSKSIFRSTARIRRVKLLCTKYLQLSYTPPETRGGDRASKVYLPRREGVISFIKTFESIQSHYCRSKSAVRLYLSNDLSMWKMFNKQNKDNFSVNYEFFRNIFSSCFNILFGSPMTDACSQCMRLEEQLKSANDDAVQNLSLIHIYVLTLQHSTLFFKRNKVIQKGRTKVSNV